MDTISVPWLDRLAHLWPDRIAVVDPDAGRRHSFDDLRRRARSLASGLAARGVRQGDRVATIMNNGVPQLDLFFACGYLGAIFAPLNWRLSTRELAALLADVDPRVVLAEREFLQVARDVAGAEAIEARNDIDDLRLPDTSLAPATVSMADPWLILYTGGTTGIPKGAVLTHGSITWNAVNTTVSWGLAESDVGPSFTPMFHTGGWNVFTLPLLMLGGRVILPQRFDPSAALKMIEEEDVTVLFMVPTMFQLVSEQPEFEETDLSRLRWAISGGAPLPGPILDRWKSKVRVFKQGYGLTEVGPNNFATPDSLAVAKRGTVGRLTFFADARIVDDGGEIVPNGTPGELLLAGPHMCAGYWRRPDATADAIRNGWFHTGDVATRDDDGFYYIVDRKKDMIITGGENVYPTEVESVLYGHAAVRECAVVGIPDATWGEAVTAVVALHRDHAVTPLELRDYMRESLARYKVPKQFVIVDGLPKSAAGKILRTEARKLVIHEG